MTSSLSGSAVSAGRHGRELLTSAPVLALDLGASRIRAAVVGGDGTLLARTEGATPAAEGPAAVRARCIALLREVRADALRAGAAPVEVIGISAPGPLDPRSGRLVEPPNLGPAFRDVPFRDPIGEALDLPAVMERDTVVAALAERHFGAARESRHFLYLTVSTGIGGAVVDDDRFVSGPDGVGGELGHVLVDIDGPLCGCGARGHLEAISSGVAIAAAAREAIAAGATGLRARARTMGGVLSARDVAEAEEAGDGDAAAIMTRARDAFAAAVVSLVDVFAPELIVVGGSIARAQGERWFGPARRAVEQHAFRMPALRVRLVPAALGDDVGLIGAVPLVTGLGERA